MLPRSPPTMVVGARLEFVRARIAAGDLVAISLLPQAAGKFKAKITVTPSRIPLSPAVQLALYATLDALLALQSVSIAIDRGHKTSAGISQVAIWMQPVLQSKVASGIAGSVGEEHTTNEPMEVDVPAKDDTALMPLVKEDEVPGVERRMFRLIVRSHQQADSKWTIMASTPLRELLERYCRRREVHLSDVRFTLNGDSFAADATADEIGLQDKGIIYATLERHGSASCSSNYAD